jgi:hypothetical protein
MEEKMEWHTRMVPGLTTQEWLAPLNAYGLKHIEKPVHLRRIFFGEQVWTVE